MDDSALNGTCILPNNNNYSLLFFVILCNNFISYSILGDYHLSLINSQILGAFLLLLFHCGAQLHAGIFKDVSKEKGHTLAEFYYTSYFYIKVRFYFKAISKKQIGS